MTSAILFAAQQIAAFGINKGLEKLLTGREDFSDRLFNVISKTIDEYQQKYPQSDQSGKFPFYKSQVLVEEFLKYRLYSINGYKINENSIQSALEQNPNIIKPTYGELDSFIHIFDKYVSKDEKLRILEVETFHKEAIFQVYDKVERILNLLEAQLVEVVPLLENAYKAEINSCIEEIKELKPNTALKHLKRLEESVNENSKHVSNKLKASLKFFMGICFEALGESDKAYENFINAYRHESKNIQHIEKACISYYFIKDENYKRLKKEIEEQDLFNAFCWAIKAFESQDIERFIKEAVPKIVIDKNQFKRLVFNNNLRTNKISSTELIKLLNVSSIKNDFPETINYDNIHHWVFILNILSISFFTSCEIPFLGFIEKNEQSIQLLELSKILTEEIEKSELNKEYNTIVFNYYWFESEIDFQESTLKNLADAYDSLKEKDSFRTMLYANTVQKHDSIANALKIINDYQGEIDENLITLKTFCQLDSPQTEEEVIEYFKRVNQINELNIQNACSYLIPIIQSNVIGKEKLKKVLEEIQFTNTSYQDLVYLLVDSLYSKDLPIEISKINEVKESLATEQKLLFFVALIYFKNKHYDECIKFQDTYLNEDKESRDLAIYILALDSSKRTNQLKLLHLLKKWRTRFSFNDHFLRIELELQQILRDWNEIEVIAEYGLSKLPNDEVFYTVYLVSLVSNEKIPQLDRELDKISKFNFTSTENALKVVSLLMHANYIESALELLYEKAKNKADSLARFNYFFFTANLPLEYFKEYEKVTDNCYVKLEIDGEVKTIQITPETISSPIIEKSIGRSKEETFTIETPLSLNLRNVRILKIMNKYLALSDDIFSESQSSFSNLPLESVKFDSSDIKSFEKALIENFGATGEERRKKVESNFEKYQNYDLSLTELTNANFDGSFVDAYYYLTLNGSEGYRVKPLKYFIKEIDFDDKKLIVDFSSGILFFELSQRLGLKYDVFTVSESIYRLIDNLIAKTEAQGDSRVSVSVYSNSIVPHFYPEDFNTNRIEFLRKLKKWFHDNSDSVIPKEKLEIIRPLYGDAKMTNTVEFVIDNTFLAQRENHILITDDIGYEKLLNVNNWFSTEKYLLKMFPERKNEILEVLLSFRYVGITINSDLLYSTYINHYKEGYNHIYNYAIRNISLPINFNPFNIFVVVDFLKKLAFNPVILKEKYKYDATNILAMLISSFPNSSYGFTLKNRIVQQFNLMGEYYNITMTALLDALRVNNQKNKVLHEQNIG